MKTPSTFYSDPNAPTQDELYHVALMYPHYINFRHYHHEVLSMCNYGDCDTCPFTTFNSDYCFLDLIDYNTYSRLQQSHPELFL